MKTCKVSHPEAVSILLEAGESVYTWEVMDLIVPEKPRKQISICEECKESFIQHEEESLCQACLEALISKSPKLCSNSFLEDAKCP
jgi:formylmethanofuran dehydrogenase subunit E